MAKKASKLNETDQVVLYVEAKNSVFNNKPVEVKPSNQMHISWMLAKAILEVGHIEGRAVTLGGYKNAKGDVIPVNDDLFSDDDFDDFDDDEDENDGTVYSIDIVRKEQELLSKESEVFGKEQETQRREEQLKQEREDFEREKQEFAKNQLQLARDQENSLASLVNSEIKDAEKAKTTDVGQGAPASPKPTGKKN